MNVGTTGAIPKWCGNKYTIGESCANNNRCKKEIGEWDRRSSHRTGFSRHPENTGSNQNTDYGGIPGNRPKIPAEFVLFIYHSNIFFENNLS